MMPRHRRRLTIAPELLAIDLADAAIRGLLRAIAIHHPPLDHEPAPKDAPVRFHARSLVQPARRLRRAFAAYRREVNNLHHDLYPYLSATRHPAARLILPVNSVLRRHTNTAQEGDGNAESSERWGSVAACDQGRSVVDRGRCPRSPRGVRQQR
jgi:hypothetical protein